MSVTLLDIFTRLSQLIFFMHHTVSHLKLLIKLIFENVHPHPFTLVEETKQNTRECEACGLR